MTMETDKDKINDPVRKTILTVGDGYAARNTRSKAENKGRAEDRERIKEIGFEFPSAFHQAIKLIKDLSPRELKVWLSEFQLTLDVMKERQGDLFRDEQLKAAKRDKAAELREQKAREEEEALKAQDANPKNDPKAGGAGKEHKKRTSGKKGEVVDLKGQPLPPNPPDDEPVMVPDGNGGERPETGDELIARVAREEQAKQEQREGAALLSTTPKSQSAIAAEKLAAAGGGLPVK